MRAALRGAGQTLAIVLGFVGFGVGLAALGRWDGGAAPAAARPYTEGVRSAERDAAEATLWLVDGFNVLHSGMLEGRERGSWWTEEVRARLLARARAFEGPAAEIWVVFDGPSPGEVLDDASPLRVVFAASADDWLLRRVRTAEDPSQLAVVTADRKLAARARHHGARVVAPAAFLSRCPGGADPSV